MPGIIPTLEQLQEDPDNLKLATAPYDPRFPMTNQTKNCWQNYVDFHKCQRAKGKEFAPCHYFQRNYRILCPNSWIEKWDEALEQGTSPFDMNPPAEYMKDQTKENHH